MTEDDLLSFPCDLPIKVFGRNEPGFESAVVAIVEGHVGLLEASRVSTQQSREGRFLSLTINIRAESRAQADAVYRELSASESVLMVL